MCDSAEEFRCPLQVPTCIDSSKYCDGLYDCLGGGDEPANCTAGMIHLDTLLAVSCCIIVFPSLVFFGSGTRVEQWLEALTGNHRIESSISTGAKEFVLCP